MDRKRSRLYRIYRYWVWRQST